MAAPGHRKRRRRSRQDGGDDQPSPLSLIEEAFHLLRTAPIGTLWLYFCGAVPFVLALYFFWADMSRSSYAARDSALGALTVTLAFVWMKFWQGLFCRRLWEQLNPSGQLVQLSRSQYFRCFAAQAAVHAVSLPIQLISLIFIGWTYSFFQNASVLAFTRDFGRRSLRGLIGQSARLAHQAWGQNILLMLIMLVVGLFAFLNIFGAVLAIPLGLKTFFGIETVFTMNPMATLFNTTFLFGAFLLTWLVIDPLMKAAYVLRCFYGLSRRTGADLLSRLAAIRAGKGAAAAGKSRELKSGPTGAAAAILIGLFALIAPASPAREPADSAAPAAAELELSIEETLRQKQYQWRLPRDHVESGNEEKSWLEQALTDLAESVEELVKNASRSIDEFFKRIFEGDRSSGKKSDGASNPGLGFISGLGLKGILQILLFALLVGLAIWLVTILAKRYRGSERIEIEETGPAGPVDLESEHIVASQLPEDEWMRLAGEQIARGDYRLAVRALFLATLAHLGERGLIRVARFKSNRDYSRELELKARALPELRDAFGENVGLFERAWYGLHEIGQAAVDRFSANYQRITWNPASASPAGAPASPSHG